MSGLGWTLIYGGLAGYSLLFGGVLAYFVPLGRRVIALAMAFGAGVLIASLTFGLMEEGFHHGGLDAAVIGLVSGGVLYYAAHALLLRGSERHTSHLKAAAARNPGLAVVTGAVLDGLPEQFALGVGVRLGANLGLLVMAAVVLSNLAEAVVASPDLVKQRGAPTTFLLWFVLGTLSTGASAGGFLLARKVSGDFLGTILAFAAGAVLAMIADTLLPEAYHRGGRLVSLATVAGFLSAFVLARASR